MPVTKCTPDGMAWWISAVLSSKGLPVGEPMYQGMIRELVAYTYSAGGWLACEINSTMQNVMLQHGPKVPPNQGQPRFQPQRAVQDAHGMPLGPNSVPPAPKYPQPARTPPGAPLSVQQNPGVIENQPGRHVPVDAPVFDGSNGDAPASMTTAPEPVIEY